MPADTRSSRKVKHDDVERAKEGQLCSDNASEDATGSKRSSRDAPSTKRDTSSPASTRKSERLKPDISRTPTPSPLRRSGRVNISPKSGKSDKNSGFSNVAQKSDTRKRGINELGMEANEVPQSVKKDSSGSNQIKKRLTSRRYMSLFEPSKKRVKSSGSDSAKDKRQGDVSPCSSSNSDSFGTERIPAAEEGLVNGKVGKCYARKGKLPVNSPVRASATISQNQRIDDQLLKDVILEDNGGSETQNDMDSSGDFVANVQEELLVEAQVDKEENKCIICMSAGKLLYCSGRGCRRGCHPGCSNSHCKGVDPAVWQCPWCTKKKINAGVHSVSEGIESIWDVRTGGDQNLGDKREKEYFVKYKGLAHAHNRWLPEKQLLQEAPELVSEFVCRGTATKWMPEWTVPHRLLLKRSLVLPNSDGCVEQDASSTLSCQHEWLVKWCGLDYSNITWELENAAFLQTSEARDLMHEYQRRQEKARRAPLLQEDGIKGKKKCPPIKPSTFPSGCDTSHLNYLRDYWTKGQNALTIGGQDHVAQTIYFISSLQANVSRPFLIITPCSSVSKWEAELSCLAPSMDVVVYGEDRDAREMIQRFEFYEEGASVMFEVLLSTVATIKEDLEFMKRISWEAIIIDECHKPLCLAEYTFIKELASGSMLVLLMEQINDDVVDYRNILSLLKCNDGSCDIDGRTVDSTSSMSELKEKLFPFIVYGCKSVPSRLVEYWVPAQMSNMQLEQYCFSLLSNSTALCSKNDPVGVLPNILMSTRKCCDHPYTVNETLQAQFAPEMKLDIGVKASGKLHLLDAILQQMKDKGKKVVVLFKSLVGIGEVLLGDILDDFVRQRFGADSYERVDSGGLPSKKQACIAKFIKEPGIFVLLLETRACSSSIKLASVDAVIIFGSDWNPLNDLRALQKIKMDSKVEPINVFRLYTACTIEEKELILSKRNILLESTLQGISFTNSHMLLAWGASYLFKKLKEFHDSDGCTEILPRNSFLKEVVEEFMSLLHKNGSFTRGKYISRARQNGGCYSNDISLHGEQCVDLEGQDQPRSLWRKLLEGVQPVWRYLSFTSQRNRKRVQYCTETTETSLQSDEATKRTKKRGSISDGPCSIPSNNDAEKEPDCCMKFSGSIDGTSVAQKFQTTISTEKLRDERRHLHQMLKSEMTEIFSTLGLEEDVQKMAQRFLQYVINNNRVDPDHTETLLQAFKISVCWSAAAMLDKKVDHMESLALAREHLKFNCNDEQAESVFSKMQPLRKLFLLRSGDLSLETSSKVLVQGTEGSSRETNGNVQGSTVSKQNSVKVEGHFLAQDGFNERVFAPQSENEMSKHIKKLKKHCRKRLDLLIQKQLNRVEEFHKLWQEKKEPLEKDYRLKSAVIRSIHSGTSVRTDKLKDLEREHKQKVDQLDSEMTALLKDIEAKNQAEKEEEEKKAIRLLGEFTVRTKGELSDNQRLKGPLEECREEEVPTNSSSLSGTNLEEENTNAIVQSSAGMLPEPSENPSSRKVAEDSDSVEIVVPVEDRLISGNDVTPATNQNSDDVTSANLADIAVVSRLGVQSSHVPSAVSADDIGRAATTRCNQSSGANSTTQTTEVQEVEPTTQTETEAHEVEPTTQTTEAHEVEHTTQKETEAHEVELTTQTETEAHEVEPTTQTETETHEVEPSVSPICTAPRAEHHVEDNNSVQVEQTPSMMNQSEVQPVGNQHQEPENPAGRLNASSGQHGCAETSGMQNGVVQDVTPSSDSAHEPVSPELSADLLTTSISPGNSTQPCLPSSGVPVNHSAVSSIQEEQRPPNLSVTASAQPSIGVSLPPHNSSQVEIHLPGRSLPATPSLWGHSQDIGKESDPLQREYERLCGESSQAFKNYEEMVSCLRLECDKEMEEIVAQIRRKYDMRLREAEASFLQKKNEFDHNQRKVLMNMALAEAFRSKCIDHRAAQGGQQVPSSFTQHLLETQHAAGRSVMPALVVPQTAAAPSVQHGNRFIVRPSVTTTQPQRSNPPFSSAYRPVSNAVNVRNPSMSTMATSVQATGVSTQSLHCPKSAPPPHVPPASSAGPYGLQAAPNFARAVTAPQNHDSFAQLLANAAHETGAAAPGTPLLPLPEVARNFESCNLTEFGTLLDAQQIDPSSQNGTSADGVVCLSDDE